MDGSIINLQGKVGLVAGIANEKSIAYGAARAFRDFGAELAVTYMNDKAGSFVRPLAESLGCGIIERSDVQDETEMEALFAKIGERWGRLDFLLHSIAYAPSADLKGRVVDSSRVGFEMAMDISCHSFIRMARAAEKLMKKGGSILTVTYYGSEKVVPHYGIMGVVKAALEASVRYMAAELGGSGIRVNAISPGPIMTRAASGIEGFGEIIKEAENKSPLHRLAGIGEVGMLAAYLASDAARSITGTVHYIDSGYQIMD